MIVKVFSLYIDSYNTYAIDTLQTKNILYSLPENRKVTRHCIKLVANLQYFRFR